MLNKPVFIISLHRSGSTLLKNILDSNSQVAMATDEMHLSDPFFKTFDQICDGFGDLYDDNILKKLVDLIFTKEIRGTFWKDYKKLDISREKIFGRIKKTDRTLKSIITILLDEYRKKEDKERVGVKYPLHHSRLKLLLDWFPNSKVIFLFRDIRAICASALYSKDTLKRKRKYLIKPLVHYIHLFYFVLDYMWFVFSYKKFKKNSFKVKYENLILDPKETVKNICDFCEINYESKMLHACGKPSSHTEKVHYGFDKSRILKWEKKLNSFDKFLITILSYFINKTVEK